MKLPGYKTGPIGDEKANNSAPAADKTTRVPHTKV
jgi:hypothetical protein